MTPAQSRYLTLVEQLANMRRDIRLLVVGKTRPARDIVELYDLGQRDFGESHVDEGVAKIRQLHGLDGLCWHYVGPIQRNKTRPIAEHFTWVQSLDRPLIADRLARQRPAGLAPLQVLVQVNIDREPQKAGCDPGQVLELCQHIRQLPRLSLRGLMVIPRLTDEANRTRDSFLRARDCFHRCIDHGIEMDTLSMGMSSDWRLAIECGSSMVRIGSALFGPRGQA